MEFYIFRYKLLKKIFFPEGMALFRIVDRSDVTSSMEM
jgi:hypothetical protein